MRKALYVVVISALSLPVVRAQDKAAPTPQIERGRELFTNAKKGVACKTCHSLAGIGTAIGPDMTNLDKAGVAVLGYRLVNFWLPIPVGGISYLTLRFETLGWRQRLREAREEIVEHPSQASLNGTKTTSPPPAPSDRDTIDATVEAPNPEVPVADTSGPRTVDKPPPARPEEKAKIKRRSVPGDAAAS